MSKDIFFICSSCGYESPKWLGKCPSCNSWNSFSEEKKSNIIQSKKEISIDDIELHKISDLEISTENRIQTNIKELDRVFGGGIVKNSLTLLGGAPGIGKSTLTMQLCAILSSKYKVIYISAEESASQLKMRAIRLGLDKSNIFLLVENRFEAILKIILREKPDFVIIDSIQTLYSDDIKSAPGSVSQLRELTFKIMTYSKKYSFTSILIGHITKDGIIAGPKILEHMVDTVLYFEGDKNGYLRILRSIKNRFGTTNEIGIFEMRNKGLVEVLNPSMLFVSLSENKAPGSASIMIMEGTRPLLIEVQALILKTDYNIPKRTIVGIDSRRVNMLLAILDRYLNLKFATSDVYVNVVGGLKVDETAIDLGVAASLISNFIDKEIDYKTSFIGELGLSGEIRAVVFIDLRLKELIKLGIKKVVVPKDNMKFIKDLGIDLDIELIYISHISELIRLINKS